VFFSLFVFRQTCPRWPANSNHLITTESARLAIVESDVIWQQMQAVYGRHIMSNELTWGLALIGSHNIAIELQRFWRKIRRKKQLVSLKCVNLHFSINYCNIKPMLATVCFL